MVVVALAGLLRGPGDAAKAAIIPEVVDATGVPMERATGLHSAAERLASTAGAALAGLLVAVLGPVNALLLDAANLRRRRGAHRRHGTAARTPAGG
jgi:hypothetical protein